MDTLKSSRSSELPPRGRFSELWDLDPEVVYLNHGVFGACPAAIRKKQTAIQARMELQPVRFFERDLPGLLDAARQSTAAYLGAEPEGLAFVTNATEGVNAVLRSFPLESGDEVLVTDHTYEACFRAAGFVSRKAGARVAVARIPFPLAEPEEVVERVVDAVTERTRIAVIDHVTSPTGLVLPVRDLTRELESRGVAVLVDGAHAPGMVPLRIDELGASWYAGNFHKWLCAPKGSGMLWTREDRRESTRPLCISHGAGTSVEDNQRYRHEFDWTGTRDFSAWLVVPDCIEMLGGLRDGGWKAHMSENRALSLRGRELLCGRLGMEAPAPEDMIGSLAAVPLSPGPPLGTSSSMEPLQKLLIDKWKVDVTVTRWPSEPSRVLRISTQAYNGVEELEYLAEVLPAALSEADRCG